jgi:hypothetical protein
VSVYLRVQYPLVFSSNDLWRPDPPSFPPLANDYASAVLTKASDWLEYRQRSFLTIDALLIHGIFLLPINAVVQSTRRAFVSKFAYSSCSSMLSLYVDNRCGV